MEGFGLATEIDKKKISVQIERVASCAIIAAFVSTKASILENPKRKQCPQNASAGFHIEANLSSPLKTLYQRIASPANLERTARNAMYI